MEFLYEDLSESVLCECSWAEKDLEFVEATKWSQDHKMQSREVIFKHNGKYYCVPEYREGSPFQGWETVVYMHTITNGYIECDEVKKISKLVTRWVTPEYAQKKLEESMQAVENSELHDEQLANNKKNGHEYVISFHALHSETLEPLVTYIDQDGIRWARPLPLFMEKFDIREYK